MNSTHSVYRAPQEGRPFEFLSCWFSGLPPVQSEETALLTFWDLSNYKCDCRQDAQPIPNS